MKKELIVVQNPNSRNDWQFIQYCCYRLKHSVMDGWDSDLCKIHHQINTKKNEYLDQCPYCKTPINLVKDPNFRYKPQ